MPLRKIHSGKPKLLHLSSFITKAFRLLVHREGVVAMENIKPTEWIVCYYGEKIYLTNDQHKAFLDGLRKKLSVIQIDDLTLTDKFTFMVHKSELEADRLNDEEYQWSTRIAEWISRPVNNSNMDQKTAERYSKKLIKRIGTARIKQLWKNYAQSACPSVFKFMAEAKESTQGAINNDLPLLE